MEREYQIETTELTDEELEAANGGAVNFGSGFGKVGVALNAAQGGSKAAALYWLLFG
jgi:lactobin A/cerein 7B family class IIb bacteriocin